MSGLDTRDYYAQLRLSPTASPDEIRDAYRREAAAAPDRVRLREVEEAYLVLADPDRRARYDRLRDGGAAAPAGPTAPPLTEARAPESPAAPERRLAPVPSPVDEPPLSLPARPGGEPTAGGGSVLFAFVAALLAALLGAVAWGFVVKSTDYELGALAWGIGFVAAAAAWIAAGRKGGDVQVAAVAAALVGVLVGKYLSFALVVQDQSGDTIGLFSAEMRTLFGENIGTIFGLYDLVWIGLAAATAWYLLRTDVAAETADPEAPSLPAPEHAEEQRHSRNPVDRLTRGLPHGWRVTIDWAVTIVGAVAIVLAIKAWVVNPYRIPSSSMEPTLHCARPANACESGFSDRVLANRFIYRLRDPKRGEIVVFRTPPLAKQRCGAGGTFVKRLIGLPGERVELRPRQGRTFVYINGKVLDEPYLERNRRGSGEAENFQVPAGHYFMMGDNRTKSCDSREWGSVPRSNLIGKVFATYWPPNRISIR